MQLGFCRLTSSVSPGFLLTLSRDRKDGGRKGDCFLLGAVQSASPQQQPFTRQQYLAPETAGSFPASFHTPQLSSLFLPWEPAWAGPTSRPPRVCSSVLQRPSLSLRAGPCSQSLSTNPSRVVSDSPIFSFSPAPNGLHSFLFVLAVFSTLLPDSLYEMLPGKIISVGCIFLCSTVGYASPQECSFTAFDIPSIARTFVSLTCRCLISWRGATGHHLLPESHPVACTFSLCIPDILVPAPLLHHSASSTFLLLPSQLSPRQCHNAGHCLSHTSDQIPNLEELPQKNLLLALN